MLRGIIRLIFHEVKVMRLSVEVEQEEDGRWLSEVIELPGVLAYGETRAEAIVGAQVLALRVIADRIEHGEALPHQADVLPQVFSVAA
jgi:predicted RNase H-like HicB family nuclease